MPILSKISFSDKNTGDEFLATELNELKNKVNLSIDAQNASSVYREYRLSNSGVPNDATLEMETSTFGTDGTAAIQAVLDKAKTGPIKIIWDTKTRINEGGIPLKVYSNTTIVGINGGGWVSTTNSNCFNLINANPVSMNGNVLGTIIDENITIENIIYNMNGLRGLAPQQVHHIDNVGWTIGIRLAGVRNLRMDKMYAVNQRTFSIYLSNCEKVNIGYLDFRCNPTRQVSGTYAGFYTGNTDGIKIQACTDVNIDKIAGNCGDDLFSIVGNDGLFPVGSSYPSFTDPYAVYGRCTNIYIREVFFDNSDFGGRLLSTDSLVDNVRIDYMHGTTQGQFFVIDNLARNAGACYQKNTGSNDGGVFGNISFGTIDVECTGLAPYYKAWMWLESDAGKNGFIRSLSIDKITRHSNEFALFPTFRATNINLGYLTINQSEIKVSNATNDNPLIQFIASTARKLQIKNADMDRTVNNNRTTGPLLAIETGSVINNLVLTNISSSNANFIVEQRGGIVKNLLASQVFADNSYNPYYVANGSTINVATVSNYANNNSFFLPNSGTISSAFGDGFVTTTNSTTPTPVTHTTSVVMKATSNPYKPPVSGSGATLPVTLSLVAAAGSDVVSVLYRITAGGVDYDIATITTGSTFPYDWQLGAQGDSDLQLFCVATLSDNTKITSAYYTLQVRN